jgi:hypothetical protein
VLAVAGPWHGAVGLAPASPARFDVRDGADRLLLLGIDGLDGQLLDALASGDAGSRLRAAMREGAVYPLRRRSGAEPPEVWTTLLTGAPADVHRITGPDARRLPGVTAPLSRSGRMPLDAAVRFLLPARRVPATASARGVRTLWEIVALRHRVAAVGWWASWPASEDPHELPGYRVTDRVLPKLITGDAADRDTLPESLFARLAADFPSDLGAIEEAFGREFRVEPTSEAWPWLRESYVIDAYAWQVARSLLGDPQVRASFVYLPGLDILRHRLETQGDSDLASLLGVRPALESYLRWLDRLIDQARAEAAEGTLLIATDPGRRGDAASEGFVLLLGAAAEPGCVGPAIEALDLTPLALDLLGFPSSAEMSGRAPRACRGAGGGPADPAPPVVATFGRRVQDPARSESDYDEEMLKRLKSLGYLN